MLRMTWAGLPINEDEDADALLKEFIRLCAHYKITDNEGNHTFATVGKYVFANLRDPGLRGEQCGMAWGYDLAVLERIKQQIANGAAGNLSLTKAEWQAKIIAATENTKLTPTEKKSVLEGLRLYGESESWVTKSADAKSSGNVPPNAVDFLTKLAEKLPN